MIVILKKDISQENLNRLLEKLREYDCSYLLYENGEPILRIKTKQNVLTKDFFLSQPGVENVYRITPAYELATRKSADHAEMLFQRALSIAEKSDRKSVV